jgi:hypothetical protein
LSNTDRRTRWSYGNGCYWYFEWISFRIINKMPKQDIFVGMLVAVITILLQFSLAVLIVLLFRSWFSLGKAQTYSKNMMLMA